MTSRAACTPPSCIRPLVLVFAVRRFGFRRQLHELLAGTCGSWPMKRPSAIKDWTVAMAPPLADSVGRMIEHGGRSGLRNWHGSGWIRLVWNIWLPAA